MTTYKENCSTDQNGDFVCKKITEVTRKCPGVPNEVVSREEETYPGDQNPSNRSITFDVFGGQSSFLQNFFSRDMDPWGNIFGVDLEDFVVDIDQSPMNYQGGNPMPTEFENENQQYPEPENWKL
eukprot:TRINITY_DN651_c1_g1_i1.p1 TRINITY_DN651_c1_g1~~TRINITY_DN651_c1_g1_i1.p1  ORF type:complete len:147 (-),score=35.96 TRINITY_DN651_c1_g1_i1:147-521(-)